MNILILSCGTRNKIVQYFKRELNGEGKVIATDCWELAPALYEADKYYVVPRITDPSYIEEILSICKKESIMGIFSLIDPELSLLAQNKARFIEKGIYSFISDYEVVEKCFDKWKMYEFCCANGIKTVPTYKNYKEFEMAFNSGKIQFPVLIKPSKGSCSIKIQKVDDLQTVQKLCAQESDYIIQKYMIGQEYGIDLYTDFLTKEVVSIFIKKKILMRAGETDKSVSILREDIFSFTKKLASNLGTIGQIDIDVFDVEGELYLLEVNPRFGGGYPHAYECGVNFPKLMLNNLSNRLNFSQIGNYKQGSVMMKYLDLKIIEGKVLE